MRLLDVRTMRTFVPLGTRIVLVRLDELRDLRALRRVREDLTKRPLESRRGMGIPFKSDSICMSSKQDTPPGVAGQTMLQTTVPDAGATNVKANGASAAAVVVADVPHGIRSTPAGP